MFLSLGLEPKRYRTVATNLISLSMLKFVIKFFKIIEQIHNS